MKVVNLVYLLCALLVSSNASAALIERLGGLAYYDDVADITWLADANFAQTQYENSGGLEGDADGRMTWDVANSWATGLNIQGVTGWRLFNAVDYGNDGATYSNIYEGVDYGYNITKSSELSNLYYNVLNNIALYDISGTNQQGYGMVNTGPFTNTGADKDQHSLWYWSSTEYALFNDSAWYFSTAYGYQYYGGKTYEMYAWAVRSGDVGVVPVPAAVWLFGSGLIGLVAVARRKCHI